MLKWFSAREATDVGVALADDFVLQSASGSAAQRKGGAAGAAGRDLQKFMQRFLQRVDRDAGPLQLNLFKRAKLANSFKWRLLEKGVEKDLVEDLTRALVLRLTTAKADSQLLSDNSPPVTQRRNRGAIQALLQRGNEHTAHGAWAEAADCYQELLASDPRNFMARNNLGVALCRLGRYHEGGDQFRQAIGIKESCADAHANLGSLLRSQGRFIESEPPLRRALKLRPTLRGAQISLASSLFMLGRLPEARELLEKVLKVAPRELDALLSFGALTAREGRFAEAETWFKRALEVDPKASSAWVGLAALRKMTPGDDTWLKGAQASADSGLAPLNEANVRYAIGKYYDETGEFAKAFRSYQRANELVKTAAEVYDRGGRSRVVDDLIRTYPQATLARAERGASDSTLPVFVVGMPRSGTTLVEQIIASHPAAQGAGELEFWSYVVIKHVTSVRHEPPGEATRRKLAEGYLRVLTANSAGAQRVVDKSPFNSDYLGIIHSVFPKARFIYVRRDPVDTCLSCYFQDFPPTIHFKLDLEDLAHFYREHHRLIEHWRSALPAGTLLDVPYEELIADQPGWTRRILEFLDLPWDERCLNFHSTDRNVLTASYWQVRQRIYSSSIGRWRNYEKFIGPLLALKGIG